MKIFMSLAVNSLYVLHGMDLDSISCLACFICGGNIIPLYLFNESSFIDLQINTTLLMIVYSFITFMFQPANTAR
jgi:hypothetical protein